MAIETGTAGTSASTAIGEVIALDGTGGRSPRAWAKDPATEQPRLLEVGSPVYANEIIITGPKAVIAIEFVDGSRFDLGRGSEMALGPDIFDPTRLAETQPAAPAEDSPAGAAPLTDVEAIQQALLAGVDPTAELEATAAGPGAGGDGSNEGSSFVFLERSGQRTTPESGYETDPIGVSFDQRVDELLLEPIPPGFELVIGEADPVNENDLPDGSDTTPESLSSLGTIRVFAPDGIDSLVVGGISVISGGLFTPVSGTIQTAGGPTTLSFLSFDASTGIVTYAFTLTDNLGHSTGAGTNEITQNVGVVLTDVDGDSAAAELSLTIIDDVPDAIDDAANTSETAVSEDSETFTVEGNVLTNDIQGADRIPTDPQDPGVGPVTPQASAQGEFGVLTLNADGSYTYTLDPELEAFEALGGGGSAVETFSYTLNDSDGDNDTATLSINVLNVDDPVTLTGLDGEGDEGTVYEAALPGGSSPDQDPDDNPDDAVHTGQFSISGEDGLASVQIGSTIISIDQLLNLTSPIAVATDPSLGNSLVITAYDGDDTEGTLSYTYTLIGGETHPDGGENNSIVEDFVVTVTDTDDDSDSDVLSIQIVDDVPDVDVQRGTGGFDGEQSPDSIPAEPGEDDPNFIYEDDSEGLQGTWSHVYGADSGDDNHADDPDTIKVAVDGVAGEFDLGEPIQTGQGVLTVLGDGTWTFNPTSSAQPDEVETVTFSVTVTDSDGDVATDSHSICVFDGEGPGDGEGVSLTVQEAEINDTDSKNIQFTLGSDALASMVFSGTVGSTTGDFNDSAIDWSGAGTGTLTGTVDGEPSIKLTLTDIDLDAGTATVNVELSEAFQHSLASDNNTFTVNGIEVLATDIDGDTATTLAAVTVVDDVPNISISPADAADQPPTTDVIAEDAEGVLTGSWSHDYGADTDENGHDTAPATITVSIAGDATVYDVGDSINTDQGVLTVNSDGTWTFDPTNGLDHDDPQDVVFTTTITDADGDPAYDTHTISVVDGQDPGDGEGVALTVQEAEINDTDSKTIQFTLGSDALASMVFSGTVGSITGDYNDSEIVWSGAGTDTLTGSVDGVPSVELTLTNVDLGAGTATVNVELSEAFQHSLASGNNTFTVNGIEVLATDIDGDTAKTLASVTVVDDIPEVTAVQQGIITGKDGVLTGQITVDSGADEPLTVSIVGHDSEEVIYGDQYTLGGLAAIDVFLPADGEGEPTKFGTLTVQPDGTYSFDMETEVLPQTFGIDFTSNSGEPGGPVGSVVFTWDDNDGNSDPVVATFTANSTEVDPDFINISGNGMGVDNNLVNESSDESITVEFSENGVTNREFTNELGFAINKLSEDEYIRWTAYDSSGTMRTGLFKGGQGESSTVAMTLVVANLASGTNYDFIEIDPFTDTGGDTFTGIHEMTFEMESGNGTSFRVLSMSASESGTLIPDDLQLNFDIGFEDADGDATDIVNLGIYVEADDVLGSGYTITGENVSESILGSPATDVISGNGGDDTIDGADGADTIQGGLGDDSLNGGAGADTFVYDAEIDEGHDTITDFEASAVDADPDEDVLRIEDVLERPDDGDSVLDYLDAIESVTHDGTGSSGNTTLHLYSGTSIELVGFGNYELGDLLDSGIEIQLVPPDS